MKPILIILISLFTPTAYGQSGVADSNGFTNKAEAKNLIMNGLKEGKWVEYFDQNHHPTTDTNVAFTYYLSCYKKGQLYGIVRGYYRNGQLSSEHPYSNNILNGVEKWYSANGKLGEELPYINGKRNGLDREYFWSGKLHSEIPYVNGKINGVRKDYYEKGEEVSVEAPYTNDTVNGLEKFYYESGALESEEPYNNGKLNGIQKEYYESGKLKSETTYSDGIKGATKNYDENGNEIKQ